MLSGGQTVPFEVFLLALIASQIAFAQAAGIPHMVSPVISPPVISIFSSPSGVAVRSYGSGGSALDLGAVSYYRGASTPGETSRKQGGALVLSTRFTFRVDCPGSSSGSLVDVTMARLDADPSHDIAVDGTTVGSAAQVFVQSLLCGTSGEHRLDVAVPVSTPAGAIGSTVAFVATLRK